MYSCCNLDLPLPPTGLPLYLENLPLGCSTKCLVVFIVKILGIQFSKIPMNKSLRHPWTKYNNYNDDEETKIREKKN